MCEDWITKKYHVPPFAKIFQTFKILRNQNFYQLPSKNNFINCFLATSHVSFRDGHSRFFPRHRALVISTERKTAWFHGTDTNWAASGRWNDRFYRLPNSYWKGDDSRWAVKLRDNVNSDKEMRVSFSGYLEFRECVVACHCYSSDQKLCVVANVHPLVSLVFIPI